MREKGAVKLKKIFTAFLAISLLGIVLIGCSTSSFNIKSKEVSTVKLSYFIDFHRIPENFIKTFDDEKDIKGIIDAINNSEELKGDVDIDGADYNLHLYFNDGTTKVFYLWIEESYSGSIMEIENTHTLYKLSNNSAEKLREILKK